MEPLPPPPGRRGGLRLPPRAASWKALALGAIALLIVVLAAVAVYAITKTIQTKNQKHSSPAPSSAVPIYAVENFKVAYITLTNSTSNRPSTPFNFSYSVSRSEPLGGDNNNVSISAGVLGNSTGFIMLHIGRFGTPGSKIFSEAIKKTMKLTQQQASDMDPVLKSNKPISFQLRVAETASTVRLICPIDYDPYLNLIVKNICL